MVEEPKMLFIIKSPCTLVRYLFIFTTSGFEKLHEVVESYAQNGSPV